ncbi:RNase H domain-containing protein [Aphis craccivora]|uniref:RNase H domain-containing protein n=1 Tax=Aphis craccivora TaxID=307492 RepID=A0A6G0VRB9_APHCR|nr:RNase H domain-containing protein [Aphis craccivora]
MFWHLEKTEEVFNFIYTDASKTSVGSIFYNRILIISDFLSALLVIVAPNPSNKIIYQIHNIITSTQKAIDIMWVPSHTGISSNEKADSLANEAITSSSSTAINTLPYHDTIRSISILIANMWQTSWDETPTTIIN